MDATRGNIMDTVSLTGSHEVTVQEVNRIAELAGIAVKQVAERAGGQEAVLRLEEIAGARVRVKASFHPAYAPYFASGSITLELPAQAEDLLELMLAAGSTRRGLTIGVVGASGGIGVTALACWIASCLPARAALADLDPASAGLLGFLAMENAAGLRWADIPESAGVLVPGRLADALPARGTLRVLSADGRGAVVPTGTVGQRAIDALSQSHDHTVLDLPRLALQPGSTAATWLDWCDHLVVLTVPGVRGVSQAKLALSRLTSRTVTVATRATNKLEAASFAEEIDHPVHLIRPLRGFDADIEHGLALGSRTRSATHRDISRLARTLAEKSAV
ncbi:hypothetical protein [Actinobaculum suis]|uniref:Helicase/secretion neighborhood CpaE-like protein n=2 Tax=Actinobaculum suis TaxID=1657 RepID=A0AAW9HL96_9ACTO|nr:hypothetical protein [Actinobaculum suis]MDY5152473.1 hypothetical protein [Actinobaculum suis]